MRLQLIIAGAVALAAAEARAQAEVEPAAVAGVRVYADDDHVTVWSPSARATATLPRGVVVDAHVVMDAVTAASIDVTSSASPYAFAERRLEGGGGVAVPVAAQQQVGATVVVSDEHDYTSLRVGAVTLEHRLGLGHEHRGVTHRQRHRRRRLERAAGDDRQRPRGAGAGHGTTTRGAR